MLVLLSAQLLFPCSLSSLGQSWAQGIPRTYYYQGVKVEMPCLNDENLNNVSYLYPHKMHTNCVHLFRGKVLPPFQQD